MAAMVKDFLETLLNELKTVAKTETIFGEPIQVGDRTFIPVSKVTLGLGAGGGEGEAPEEHGKKVGGGGVGGGGGVSVNPIAVIVIDAEGVKALSFGKGAGWEKLIEAVPTLLGKIKEMKEAKEAKAEGEE